MQRDRTKCLNILWGKLDYISPQKLLGFIYTPPVDASL